MLFWPTLATYKIFFKPQGVICKLGQPQGPILHLFLFFLSLHVFNFSYLLWKNSLYPLNFEVFFNLNPNV